MKNLYWHRICGAVLTAVILTGLPDPSSSQQRGDASPAAVTNHPENSPALEAAAPGSEEAAQAQSARRKRSREAVVAIGTKAELKADEIAEAVVAVFGSAIARGEVRQAVVAVAGNATVSGKVGDATVAVLGDVAIEEGAEVRGDVVSVGGGVKIAEGAQVRGQIVCVGGRVDLAEGASVGRGVQEVPVPGLHALKEWLVQCVFKLRPLAPRIGWLWVVAGVFFLVYLLIAAVMPKPVAACARELARRPVTTFLMGLLTLLLVPVVVFILAATGFGVFVIPFLGAAVFLAKLIGKVALLEFLGESVVRAFSSTTQLKPVLALLLGSLILAAVYLVPVLGLIAFMVTGSWALGAAVMGMFGSARREMPEPPLIPSPPTMPAGGTSPFPAGTAAFATASTPPTTAGPADALASGGGTAEGADLNPPPTPMAVTAPAPGTAPEAFSHPRAGFWERMAAGFLDVVLVSLLGSITGRPSLAMLVALAYFSGMWAWKGTTIGGIVLNLKVVRLDAQPVTFAVALVRGLAAAFSTIVMFLGFLWIAWDKDRQGWHDKIAGTVVIRLPRGTPLVVL